MNGSRTVWFRYVECRPVREGWYEASAGEEHILTGRVYWDGQVFRTKPDGITRFTSHWRGLTKRAYVAELREQARIATPANDATTKDWLRWAQRHTMPMPKPKITMYEELGKAPKTWDEWKKDEVQAPKHVLKGVGEFLFGNDEKDKANGVLPDHMLKRWDKEHDDMLKQWIVGNSDDPKPAPSPYEAQKQATDALLKLLQTGSESLIKQGIGWPKVHSRIAAEVQLEKFLAMEPRHLAVANYVNAKANSNDEIAFFSSSVKFIDLLRKYKHVFSALNNVPR